MKVDDWFRSHLDVGFVINYPKTKAGHKCDIDMWDFKGRAKTFRETITYKMISDERLIELLDDMYQDIKRQIERSNFNEDRGSLQE